MDVEDLFGDGGEAEEPGRPVMQARAVVRSAPAALALQLYNATCSRPLRREWHGVHPVLLPYLQHVYAAMGEPLEAVAGEPAAWGAAADNGTMWVGFSGGKDGMAAALLARAQGYKVVLYHCHGINRAWPDELGWAARAAAAAGMPLVVDHVSVSGKKQGLLELPTKNQVTTLFMLARMLAHGGAHYTQGTLAQDTHDRLHPELNWSDGDTSVALFADYAAAAMLGVQYHPLLQHSTQALAVVAEHGLVEHVHGCMAPMRFRENWRAANERKYGTLLPGRCGSCYKCAQEGLALQALGYAMLPAEQAAHYRRVLEKFTAGASGLEAADVDAVYWLRPQDVLPYARATWPEELPAPAGEALGLPVPEALGPLAEGEQAPAYPAGAVVVGVDMGEAGGESTVTALYGHDLFGEVVVPPSSGPVAARFTMPPFTLLDARSSDWQERKRAWLSLGIRSEETREGLETHVDRKRLEKPGGDFFAEQVMARGGNASVFDPVLCELAYRWFCPEGGLVLDPFAGGSVRGVVAGMLGRRYYGVDLRAEQVAANHVQADELRPPVRPQWVAGDSRVVVPGAPQADMVFSCPPYADLEVYSEDPADLSNMPWQDFAAAYRAIIAATVERMREDTYAVWVVGDVRDKSGGRYGGYRGLVGLTIDAFLAAGCTYYNEAIIATPVGTAALRVTKHFISGRKFEKVHQNLLVFVRGDWRRAAARCPLEVAQ